MSDDETARKAKPFDGDKLYQQRARAALPLLVRQAKVQQTIYYANLAEELRIPNPRNLNFVLGSVGRSLVRLGQERGWDIPPIQCLVVIPITARNETLGWSASVCLIEHPTRADELRDARPAGA